jgi:predicted hotdog family 3-hydroxylacyl-ACP dehydratase
MTGVNVQLGVQYKITDLVAHADRMQLLDEVLSYDNEQIVVALTIRDNTEFYVPGTGVPAWVGIEYMAQAVGAFSGIEEVQSGRKPQIGLLLGSRRCTSDVDVFRLGERLEVIAQLQMRDESDLAVFHCEIAIEGKCIARGDLKAIRPRDVEALIAAQAAENKAAQGFRVE